MNYPLRKIKIQLPTKEFISIQIPENETKLKDLLSTITKSSSSKIKGLKDSKGNYYTLSSLIKNINLFQLEEDIYFELIFRHRNYSLYEKQYEYLNINEESYTDNYFNKSYIFHNKTTSMNELSQIEIQKFSSYLLQLLSKKQINENQFFEFNKMMKEQNKQLIRQFKFFLEGKITNENFLILLNLFNDNIIKKKIFIQKEKNKNLNKNEEILKKMNEFFSNEDYEILKEIIKSENSNLNIKKYKSEGNICELILFFQKEINKHKEQIRPKKSESSLTLNDNYKFQKRLFDKKNIKRHKSLPQGNIDNENNKNKTFTEFKTYKKKDNDNIENKKSNKSEKKLNKIKKHLNEPFKILLQYFFENNKNEYNKLLEIYTENKKLKNKSYTSLNEYCMKFIDNEIINYLNKKNYNLSEKKFKILHYLIETNQTEILNSFLNFSKTNSLKTLVKELISMIKKKKSLSISIKKTKKIDNKIDNESTSYIDNFIESLQQLQILNEEKEKIKEMIKEKNQEIELILNEYKNNKNNLLLEEKIKKLFQEQISNPKYKCKTINSLEENMINDNEITNDLEGFKKLLNKTSFSKEEISFLIGQYSKKNSILISIFNVYLNKLDLNDFKESINIFLKKENKTLNNSPKNKNKNSLSDFSNTPEAVKESKGKLDLLMNSKILKNKNVLIKQKEIINLLYQEKCIEEKVYNIIEKKIIEEDSGLNSAFEVYVITKDHHEFIETLNIISELNENYKFIFYKLIHKSKFNHSEKDYLIQLFNSKNVKLLNILKSFVENKDKNLTINCMKELIE